jgi:hypothetical protein
MEHCAKYHNTLEKAEGKGKRVSFNLKMQNIIITHPRDYLFMYNAEE